MSGQNNTFTIRQVAELLDVPSRTVHRWVVKGYFPGAYKVGPERNSAYHVPQSAVDAFIEEQKNVRLCLLKKSHSLALYLKRNRAARLPT